MAGKKKPRTAAKAKAATKTATKRRTVKRDVTAKWKPKRAASAKKKAAKRPTARKPAKKPAPKPAAAKSAPKPRPVGPPANAADLSAVWNDAGRAHFTEYSARLTRYYGDNDASVDLDVSDPRTEALGDQVVRAVIDLNARGQWQRAREQFDPAHAPLMGWIKPTSRSLGFVTILGPDDLLVRRGSAWQDDGVTFHLHAGEATPVDDVRGMCRSRSRDHLVIARRAGLEVRDGRAGIAALRGPAIATIPWPDQDTFRPAGMSAKAAEQWTPPDGELDLESLQVSDDGMHIVATFYRQGILLASRHPGERPWTLLWPDARAPYNRRSDDDDAPRAGDMTHVAISRDGTRLAFGCQDVGHFLAEIEPGKAPSWYATVGHLSEYPHFAAFSDDGRYTALNSCHFYNGATIAFDWDGNRGVSLDEYEQHEQAPVIDASLRVYAGAWLHKPVLDAILGRPAKSEGAFALAGNGILRLRTVTGAVGFVQGFGSSADSMDFCPESRLLALASYSGFIHLYDPYTDELPGRIDGYRPRRELSRWVMWEHLPAGPIRW